MPRNDSTDRQGSFLGRRRVTGQYITQAFDGRDGGRGRGRGRDDDFEDGFDVDPEVGGTIWGNQPGASFLSPRTPILPY
ncbi:hypothetical protein [Terribacillus saccharophilus]|uniref:Uncharacterized protein n=1 Tax=Terribacillus saccharophilus TaxID=361277 RepID=A0AAX2EGG5_9BACI|nr:hypothetical protein [Terribacillus saccharophilus]MEC0302454.1 hypothetical protein [Terribacillus saccharophilus]SEN44034.1 hypothetical protein SAMN04489762_2255 [Terribacillus saccharophilus]